MKDVPKNPSVPIVELESLVVGYGQEDVLHSLDLVVEPGSWTVLIGPNGSGKTTLIKTLMGQLAPRSGAARVDARDCSFHQVELKRIIGYLPETSHLYPELTGAEHLFFAGGMHELEPDAAEARIAELVDMLGMSAQHNQVVDAYSHGMKQKLGLAMAMIHRPRLLLLDEPMNGLDPVIAEDIREILDRLCTEDGVTVLMSSHNLTGLQRYRYDILIFSHGRIHLREPAQDLLDRHGGMSLNDIIVHTLRESEAAHADRCSRSQTSV